MSELIEVPAGLAQETETVMGKPFKNRALSYILDAVVINVVSYLIQIAVVLVISIALVLMGNSTPTQDADSLRCFSFLFALLNTLVYFVSFESLYGATPGKMMLGTRVVMEDGSPCTFKPALIRGLYRYIDGLFLGIVALAKMQLPWYQRYGDLKAHTIVVDKKESFIRKNNHLEMFFVALLIYIVVVGLGDVIAQLATIN